MTETLFTVLTTSGLPLAASILILAMVIIIGMIIYYLNKRIDNVKIDLNDYAKKIDLLEHKNGCNKDELVSGVYKKIEYYIEKLDKKIDNISDKLYIEIKSINENIIRMIEKR